VSENRPLRLTACVKAITRETRDGQRNGGAPTQRAVASPPHPKARRSRGGLSHRCTVRPRAPLGILDGGEGCGLSLCRIDPARLLPSPRTVVGWTAHRRPAVNHSRPDAPRRVHSGGRCVYSALSTARLSMRWGASSPMDAPCAPRSGAYRGTERGSRRVDDRFRRAPPSAGCRVASPRRAAPACQREGRPLKKNISSY